MSLKIIMLYMILLCLFITGCEATIPAYKNMKNQQSKIYDKIPLSEFEVFSRDYYSDTIMGNAKFDYIFLDSLSQPEERIALLDKFIEKRFSVSYVDFEPNNLKPYMTEELYDCNEAFFQALAMDMRKAKTVFFPKEVFLNPGKICKVYTDDEILGLFAKITLYTSVLENNFFDAHDYLNNGTSFINVWIYVNTDNEIIGWIEEYNERAIACFTQSTTNK